MSYALTATIASSLSLAVMIILDRLMVGDCYQGRAKQAWFVSSMAGSLFGVVLTLITWVVAVQVGSIDSLWAIFQITHNIMWPYGALMLLAGVLSIQVLLHYFYCFSEDANSTVMAAWFAATPIFVFIITMVLSMMANLGFPFLETLQSEEGIKLEYIAGILIATIGLVGFELSTTSQKGNVYKYRFHLMMMLITNSLYGIVIYTTLANASNVTEHAVLALMPFYWIGFAAGARALVKKSERETFKKLFRKRIKYFIIPILLSEIIGMLVFFLEYFGLGSLEPTYVALVIGAHVGVVYMLNLYLAMLGKRMRQNNQQKLYLLGIRLLESKMPLMAASWTSMAMELVFILLAIAGIIAVSTH